MKTIGYICGFCLVAALLAASALAANVTQPVVKSGANVGTVPVGQAANETPPDANGPVNLETCSQHKEAAYDEYCTLDATHLTMAFIEWFEAPNRNCRIVFKSPESLGIVSTTQPLSIHFRGVTANQVLCQSLVQTISSDRLVRVKVRIDKWDGYPSGDIKYVLFLPKID